ncbi:MAG: hypothetical protein V8S81_10360 [Oscillospiraceae bacterium]
MSIRRRRSSPRGGAPHHWVRRSAPGTFPHTIEWHMTGYLVEVTGEGAAAGSGSRPRSSASVPSPRPLRSLHGRSTPSEKENKTMAQLYFKYGAMARARRPTP